ncbi:hypothetical protein SLEP1_g55306 [Rubroshorea leprosula]|uniref:Uncharacterized protein n=1 Tax=Rubroshorea leprosula TaxID=152421 RepID=A0AAV5MF49_9ROSI|nr:hypothetical protein SLEP1_g55306 [Rubroshorea leprosula]
MNKGTSLAPPSYLMSGPIWIVTRARTIKRMKEMGLVKEIGVSSIELEKNVYSFVVEDRNHPQAEAIYGLLQELFRLMLDEGYVPDKRFILCYIGQD